jgi:hypothetical protein
MDNSKKQVDDTKNFIVTLFSGAGIKNYGVRGAEDAEEAIRVSMRLYRNTLGLFHLPDDGIGKMSHKTN